MVISIANGAAASPIGRGLPSLTNEVSLARKGEGFGPLRIATNPSPHSPKLTLFAKAHGPLPMGEAGLVFANTVVSQ